MIAILLLLSPMYQLNHSSILPRSSPGLSGRHGRKIGKVSPGRRWRRAEMDGMGGGVKGGAQSVTMTKRGRGKD